MTPRSQKCSCRSEESDAPLGRGMPATWRRWQARAPRLLCELLTLLLEVLVVFLRWSLRPRRERRERIPSDGRREEEDILGSSSDEFEVVAVSPSRASSRSSPHSSPRMELTPNSGASNPPSRTHRQQVGEMSTGGKRKNLPSREVEGGELWNRKSEVVRGYPSLQEMPSNPTCSHLRVRRYASQGGKGYRCVNCTAKYFRSASGEAVYRAGPLASKEFAA